MSIPDNIPILLSQIHLEETTNHFILTRKTVEKTSHAAEEAFGLLHVPAGQEPVYIQKNQLSKLGSALWGSDFEDTFRTEKERNDCSAYLLKCLELHIPSVKRHDIKLMVHLNRPSEAFFASFSTNNDPTQSEKKIALSEKEIKELLLQLEIPYSTVQQEMKEFWRHHTKQTHQIPESMAQSEKFQPIQGVQSYALLSQTELEDYCASLLQSSHPDATLALDEHIASLQQFPQETAVYQGKSIFLENVRKKIHPGKAQEEREVLESSLYPLRHFGPQLARLSNQSLSEAALDLLSSLSQQPPIKEENLSERATSILKELTDANEADWNCIWNLLQFYHKESLLLSSPDDLHKALETVQNHSIKESLLPLITKELQKNPDSKQTSTLAQSICSILQTMTNPSVQKTGILSLLTTYALSTKNKDSLRDMLMNLLPHIQDKEIQTSVTKALFTYLGNLKGNRNIQEKVRRTLAHSFHFIQDKETQALIKESLQWYLMVGEGEEEALKKAKPEQKKQIEEWVQTVHVHKEEIRKLLRELG